MHEENIRLDKTTTSTPAVLARTPDADAPNTAVTGSSGDVMARVRARLTQLKQELPGQRNSEVPALSSTPQSKRVTPINTVPPAARSTSSSDTLALLPISSMSVATAAESPRASMQGESASAGSAFRARLLDKLDRERRGAHMHHQEAHHHSDDSHSGLGDGFDSGRAGDEAGPDASVVAHTRRDAEILEARLRQQARSRMMGYKDGMQLDESVNDGLSGMTTNETLRGADLLTREEALRAKLKRSR